jgi:hypothetical protein
MKKHFIIFTSVPVTLLSSYLSYKIHSSNNNVNNHSKGDDFMVFHPYL